MTLLEECRAAIARASNTSRASIWFSALTGSVAQRSATAESDIDILVVLKDDSSTEQAWAFREAFTAEYVRLHLSTGRVPDLEWPGEVIGPRELEATLHGAAFASADPLEPVSADVPFRYWLSMFACCIPLTGSVDRLHAATDGAADQLLAWALDRYGIEEIGEAPWFEVWRLRQASPVFLASLSAAVDRARAQRHHVVPSQVTLVPPLEERRLEIAYAAAAEASRQKATPHGKRHSS